jgi:hypothetical protein
MATLALAQTAQTNQTAESAQIVKLPPVIQTSTGARSTVRHLQLAPSGGRQAKDNTLPPMTHYLGLIELDVALTKLAIHKQPTENSVLKHLTEATSDTVFFRWGQSHNKRSFALNEDGSAQYMVKTGETIISIVECLLREKHRMCPSYEPSYREIRTEIRTLRLANLDMQDLDLLEKGQWVRIPALIVCEALTGQGKLSA